VEFEWVKGHSKDEDNRAADKLARQSAGSAYNAPLKVVTVRRKKTKKRLVLGSVKNKGQKIRVRIIASESLREQKLAKYTYEVVSKRSNYYGNLDVAFSKLNLRPAHCYLVTMNKAKGNPRFVRLIEEIECN